MSFCVDINGSSFKSVNSTENVGFTTFWIKLLVVFIDNQIILNLSVKSNSCLRLRRYDHGKNISRWIDGGIEGSEGTGDGELLRQTGWGATAEAAYDTPDGHKKVLWSCAATQNDQGRAEHSADVYGALFGGNQKSAADG